jgi:protein-S-isoprenylcysteine O-methyltransferase Ste14
MKSRKLENKKPSRLMRRDWIDLGIRAALALTFAFAAGVYCHNALAEFSVMDPDHFDAHKFTRGLSIAAVGLYTAMIACLYALRLRAKSTASGFWSSAAAILGSFLMSGLLLLTPRMDLPLGVQLMACLLVLAGNIFAVYILVHLGRSFSILPQSRKLVTSGPYQVVRHPLYLAEAVATLGAMISFLSPWALALVAVQIILQIIRIHYEEKVMHETFSEYKDYAKRTWRLIPGIY